MFFILLPLVFTACSIIDDDLTLCGEELVVNYQMQLQTQLSVQLQAELSAEKDSFVRHSLDRWLAPIMTDHAEDVDLRFYAGDNDELHHQIKEVVNANRASYTIKLPKENYMHLAIANIASNRQVQISGEKHSETLNLSLGNNQTINTLPTGVFTARLPMVVNDTTKLFEVKLYMVTSAVAIVIDTTSCTDLRIVSGYMAGAANAFSIKDSIFRYDKPCRFITEQVPITAGHDNVAARSGAKSAVVSQPYTCHATVCMPTEDNRPWEVVMTANLTGNRHTTTTLTIKEPLRAGIVRVIKCNMDSDGKIVPEQDSEVGASVELDWNEGSDHDIEL